MAHRQSNLSNSSFPPTDAAAAAKQWLERIAVKGGGTLGNEVWKGGFFEALSLSGLTVSLAEGGRALGSFRVPARLTDSEGNWQAGPIATLIDNFGAVAIMTAVGHLKVSVDFGISYFSPAKIDEEVEIDARIVEHKEQLTVVLVEIRKKGDGRMVALGRQWMASRLSRPSKL